MLITADFDNSLAPDICYHRKPESLSPFYAFLLPDVSATNSSAIPVSTIVYFGVIVIDRLIELGLYFLQISKKSIDKEL